MREHILCVARVFEIQQTISVVLSCRTHLLSSMDVASRTIYVKMMRVFVRSSLPFPAQGQCKGSVTCDFN